MARRAGDDSDGGADIEFLAPDPGAFGHLGGTWSVDPASSSGGEAEAAADALPPTRRAGVLATVGLLGVVAAATVAVVPWDDDDPRTTPTTLPPPSTSVAPTPIVPTTLPTAPEGTAAPPPPGFVLTPPSDMRLAGAVNVEPGDDLQQLEGWGEVWAEPGSTRTSGRWVAITIAPFGWGNNMVPDAVRVGVDQRVGVLSTATDGVPTLVVATDFERDDRLLRIEGWGFSRDDLVAFAGSVGLESDRPQLVDDRPLYRDPSLFDGMVLLAARPTDWDPVRAGYIASATALTAYASTAEDRWIWLAQVDDSALDDVVDLGFTPVELSSDAVLSRASSLPDDLVVGTTLTGSIARWTDPASGELLLAISTLDPAELQALVPSARRASADEWSAALRTSLDVTGESRPEPSLLAGEGVLPTGAEWEVLVDPVDTEVLVRIGITEFALSAFDSADDHIGLLARPDLGLVVARRPGDNMLRITTGDGVTEQPFTDVTAVVIDTLTPVRVELLDAAGQVIDTE